MNRHKQAITLLIVFCILAGLVYLQVREFQRFDWQKFKAGTRDINWWSILLGILFVHLADFLRAIRWKIFLRPTRPSVPWTSLIAPQFVGFAGLALLGRPGELVRPYLLAKRADTSVPQQIAIWFVERAFDTAAVAAFIAIDIFFLLPPILRNDGDLRLSGYIIMALAIAFVLLLYGLWRHGQFLSNLLSRLLSPFSKSAAGVLEHKLHSASEGLHTLHDWRSFFEASAVSAAIWTLVALAYRQVTHAFPASTLLPTLDLPEVILLMGASVAGGVLQLPIVGGGSQLATIAVLTREFPAISPEYAVAAGILFWLVTFMSVAPLGIVLARFEHVSIRKLSAESESESESEAVIDPELM
jgi:glycosyltransferase 2 family protein